MREPRKDPKRLQDILHAKDTIYKYVDGLDFEAFVADKKTYHAVIYNIMIIGEAANMLTFEFREAHAELQWQLRPQLFERLKAEADSRHTSFNSYVESLLSNAIYSEPNDETIEAIEESHRGEYAGTVNLSSMKAFKRSLFMSV